MMSRICMDSSRIVGYARVQVPPQEVMFPIPPTAGGTATVPREDPSMLAHVIHAILSLLVYYNG